MSNTHQQHRNWLYWLFFCFFFLGLPVVFLFWTGQKLLDREKLAIEARQQAILDTALLTLRFPKSHEAWLSQWLTRAFRKMPKQVFSPTVIRRFTNRVEHFFPGICSIVVVGPQGEILGTLPERLPVSRSVIKKMFFALHEAWKAGGNQVLLQKDWGFIKSFVGPELSQEQLEFPLKRPLEVTFEVRHRWFYPVITSQGGLLCHISASPDLPKKVAELLVRAHSQRLAKAGVTLGIIDLHSATPDGGLRKILADSLHSKGGKVRSSGGLYHFLPVTPSLYLWARLAGSPIPSGLGLWRMMQILLLIGLTLGVWKSFLVLAMQQPFHLSLQFKIPILFFLTAVFPLGVLFVLSMDFLDQKRLDLIEQEWQETVRRTSTLGREFAQAKRRMETELRNVLLPDREDEELSLSSLRSELARTGVLRGNANLFVFDHTGALRTRIAGSRRQAIRLNPRILGLFCSRILRTLNPALPETSGNRNEALESMVASEENVRDAVKSLGRIQPFTFGGQSYWSYLSLLNHPGNKAKAQTMAVLIWEKGALEWVFLAKNQKRLAHLLDSRRIRLFQNPDQEEEFVIPKRWSYARQLLFKIRKFGGAQHLSHTRSGMDILTIGASLPLLKAIILLEKSETMISSTIQGLKTLLWSFGTVCGLACLWLSGLLITRLLTPIQALAQGVHALQQRRFEFRIPPQGSDELGQVAHHFNHLLEGMGDLDVARIVQKTLLPHDTVTTPGLVAYGTSRAAAEIGGDYFDIRVLSDRTILLAVGDYSGHGIPAALGVGAMKALMDLILPRTQEPDELLGILNERFRTVFPRRQLMTMLIARIDADTGQCSIASAGQCSPFKVTSTGTVEMIKTFGHPLGSAGRKLPPRLQIQLEPGSSLFLYTDYLYEALSGGKMLGFDRVIEGISRAVHEDPREFCQRMLAWHEQVTDSHQLQDDLTVLVLRRTA